MQKENLKYVMAYNVQQIVRINMESRVMGIVYRFHDSKQLEEFTLRDIPEEQIHIYQ